MEDDKAGIEFTDLMVKARAEMPEIGFDEEGQAGPRRFKYATLSAILPVILPILHKHGLSLTQRFGFTKDVGSCLITEIAHKGHVGLASVIHIDTSGNPQEVGKAITYFRRYSITSALCLVAGDVDTDFTGARDDPALSDAGGRARSAGVATDTARPVHPPTHVIPAFTTHRSGQVADPGDKLMGGTHMKNLLKAAKQRAVELGGEMTGRAVLAGVLTAGDFEPWPTPDGGDKVTQAQIEAWVRGIVPDSLFPSMFEAVKTYHPLMTAWPEAGNPETPF